MSSIQGAVNSAMSSVGTSIAGQEKREVAQLGLQKKKYALNLSMGKLKLTEERLKNAKQFRQAQMSKRNEMMNQAGGLNGQQQ